MKTAFIQGYGGLGHALTETLLAQGAYEHIIVASRQTMETPDNVEWLEWNIEKPKTLAKATKKLLNQNVDLQLVINSQGVLQSRMSHSQFIDTQFIHSTESIITDITPERRIETLSPENMLHLYYVNAVIPMLTVKALWPLLKKSTFAWIVNISAKVGSINDNRLGGWYSYRSSKAALNMLTKTLALELKHRKISGGSLAIHPGTVATTLSDPFILAQSPNRPDTRLTPLESASAILKIIDERQPEDSGTFWSWDGTSLPW